MKRKVVVDVDAGSDDAIAILILLCLEQQFDYTVLAITCTHGNTDLDNVSQNVLRVLETINRTDVPVFKGAASPLLLLDRPSASYFHGVDGFGDLNLPPPVTKVQDENAVIALQRLATEHGGVNLVCLGPLTNLALALRTYPEMKDHLTEVYIMGGNVHAVGNASRSAEFNFYCDPEAAHIVLSSLACPVTLLPWEPCTTSPLLLDWRFDELGSKPTKHMQLVTMIEKRLYSGAVWLPCDAFLAAIFMTSEVALKSRKVHMTVELHGIYTRGQAVLDHSGLEKTNVTLVEDIHFDKFKELVCTMACYSPKS